MGCEFSIDSKKLKEMTQFVTKALANIEEAFVLFDVKTKGVIMKAGCKGHWTEQLAKALVITPGKIVLPLELLTLYSFAGKETIFKVKKESDGINDLHIKSGRFHLDTAVSSDPKTVLEHAPEKIPLTHAFNLKDFALGLNQSSFDAITTEGSTVEKAIKIKVVNKKFVIITQDSYRGSVFKSDVECKGKDFVLKANFDSILKVINMLTTDSKNKENIEFGHNESHVRIKGKTKDFQCPLQAGEVMDVEETIDTLSRTEPESFFHAKTKEFRGAFVEISKTSKLENSREIPMIMTIVKDKNRKSKKAPPKDLLYIVARARAVQANFDIDVTSIVKDCEFIVSNVILDAALGLDGVLQVNIYPKLVMVESLDYSMKFVLPQLSKDEVINYEKGKN